MAAFAAAKVKITGVDVYPIRIPVTKDEAAAGDAAKPEEKKEEEKKEEDGAHTVERSARLERNCIEMFKTFVKTFVRRPWRRFLLS